LLEGLSSEIGMDCSVIPSKKYPDLYLVSTTDFFYPLLEDPYAQGKIACANVLSDMYAMGVVDVDSMLMLLAVSMDMPPATGSIVSQHLIRGFNDLAREAETEVVGGQTVKNPWPIIGGVAKAICKLEDIIMPVSAVAGDVIILTKPLGTQVAVNLKQWMRDDQKWSTVSDIITKPEAQRAYQISQRSMCRLNRNAAKLMHKYGAHAATDVTGFGIQGHMNNLASNQNARVSFRIHTLPVISGMARVSQALGMFRLLGGFSAETSGGLLVCLPQQNAIPFCKELEELDGWPAWIIGDVVEGDNTASIIDSPKVVEFPSS